MKSLMVSLLSLLVFVEAGTAQRSGHVRLFGGLPVAGAQVMLFDLANLQRGAVAQATTDEDGQFTLPLAALGGAFARPEGFVLGQNYPNPFNPSTIIPYELAEVAHVRLEVFNTLGQRIAKLVDGEQGAGAYRVRWNGTDASGRAVAAGVYIYRLMVGGMYQAGRMVLVDGQAGVLGGGAQLEALSMAEARSSAYGLVVSGQGLTTHVDSDFGLEMGPVEIEIEAHDSARMKVVQTQGGILGDVDNNGRVDIDDALLVIAYIEIADALGIADAFLMVEYGLDISTLIPLPNNGDISLGDVNEDGSIDFVDALLIVIYITDPSDPRLPPGIGQPTDPDVEPPTSQDESGFNIELVFLNSVLTSSQPDSVKKIVQQAAVRWESVITGDLPAVDHLSNPCDITTITNSPIRVDDVVDDLRIFVHVDSIDGSGGTLAQAGPLELRDSLLLPVISVIILDERDISSSSYFFQRIILHEMGHALGFTGDVWYEKNLLQGLGWDRFFSAFSIDWDVRFIGRRAIEAFNNAGGRDYDENDKVPVENNITLLLDWEPDWGREYSHWRESIFRQGNESELMVGRVDTSHRLPLSAITIQSFADLGYQVDVSQADPYTLSQISSKPVASHSLEIDCSLGTREIRVVDANGRIVRTITPLALRSLRE